MSLEHFVEAFLSFKSVFENISTFRVWVTLDGQRDELFENALSDTIMRELREETGNKWLDWPWVFMVSFTFVVKNKLNLSILSGCKIQCLAQTSGTNSMSLLRCFRPIVESWALSWMPNFSMFPRHLLAIVGSIMLAMTIGKDSLSEMIENSVMFGVISTLSVGSWLECLMDQLRIGHSLCQRPYQSLSKLGVMDKL